MRAIGYSRRQVLFHYLNFALVIGIVGSLTGIAVGYFLADTMTDLYIDILGLPYKIVETQWLAIEEGIFIGILPCFIAGILPAWSASRLRPAEAMRIPPPSAGRKPFLEKIFPFLKRASLMWKIPLRNIFRNRRRSISTILGIAFGVVLILASAGFIDTMDHLIKLQFEKIQTYDARLRFAHPIMEEVTSDVIAWDGINDVSPTLELPVKLESVDKSYSTALVGLSPGTDLFGLYTPQEEKTSLGTGILLGKVLEDELGVEVGDSVSVLSPFGEAVFIIDGFVKQPMGSLGYVSLENAQLLVGGQPLINGLLLAADENTISTIRDKASLDFDAVSVEITTEVKGKMEDLMNLFHAIMWIMLGFGATLALMVVFTMVTVSLVERRREIATMRTLGERSSRITAMVTIENLILGVVGLVVGIPLGYTVSLFLMRLFETDMFSFELVFYNRTYLITIGVIILIMLLSQIPGIRSLNRLDLAKVTKEQVS
jgi:putative ABC transport system permease protein